MKEEWGFSSCFDGWIEQANGRKGGEAVHHLPTLPPILIHPLVASVLNFQYLK